MKFPNFADFLKTLTEDVIKEIMDSAQTAHDKALQIGPEGELPTVSLTISAELLARYHLWLQQSLKDDECV